MKVTKQGRIIKGIGGFYTVLADDGSTCVCKARGLFRKQAKTPLVGDIVEFSYDEEREKRERTASESFCDAAHTAGGSNGYLMNLLPRKNELIRPAAANIDRLLIVVAASRPEPDLLLADKLLVCCEKLKIDPVIVINKCDEDAEGSAERIAAEYERTGYRIHRVSAAGGWGIAELKAELEDAAVCLAGQSAVGKSSLLNALLPGIALKVGSLSEKTERGRHTTRHTELIPVGNSGAVLDTPGFSLLDNIEIEPREIKNCYPEFRAVRGECRFNGCIHVSEPDCAVKKGGENVISRGRYERYVHLVKETEENKRNRF